MEKLNPDFSKLLTDPRVLELKQLFAGKGELFLVGGCVRDLLLGRKIKDIDLACRLSPAEVLSILSAADIRSLETGARHGTITAVIANNNIEITTFRGSNSPEITAESALIADLQLRDFTVNAMAVSINDARFFDPLHGLQHLNSRLLKSPEPEVSHFSDDPLRIMRMIRFGPAEGFNIHPGTLEAARKLIESIRTVSIERIQHEFSRVLISPHPRAALKMMLEIGLLEIFLPEALASVGFEQNDFHTETVFEHTLSVIENCPPDLKLRLAAFFHDLGKPHTLSVGEDGRRHFYEHEIKSTEILKEVMPRLRYPNDLTKSVAAIVKYHMRPVDCGPSGVRRLMRDLGNEFADWRKFKEADHPPVIGLQDTLPELRAFDEKVQSELERARLEKQKKLCVSGYDLMELGYQAGPNLGKVIKQLEEDVIDNPEFNNRDYLISKARKLMDRF